MKEKWAEYLRRARMIKGLSQQNLADEMGISVVSYSKIERGLTQLSLARLMQITEILGIDATQFLEEEISIEKLTNPSEASIQYKLNLNAEFIKMLGNLNALQQEVLVMKDEIKDLKARLDKRTK